MKRLQGFGVTVMVMCASLSLSAAMLRNGSFEEQGESPDRAAAWSRWGDWFNRETSWKPTRSGRCLLAYHHWRIEKLDSSGVWQDAADAPRGWEAIFSVYATADVPEDDQEGFEAVELRLETTLYGEQSTIVSRRWPRDAIETQGGWSRLMVRSVVPSEILRALIIVYPGPGRKPRGGAVKFDEARLEFVPLDE